MLRNATPDFIKLFFKQSAYRLYTVSEKFFNGPFDKYDFQTVQVLRTCLARNSNCIDVGAHNGHILREIIKAAPEGQHLAFEPIPRLFQMIKKKYGRRAQLYNYALSDAPGTAEFTYYTRRPAVSGFKERHHLGETQSEQIKVETRRLDDVVPANLPIDLVKIDVEGAELLVLRGAMETLRKHQPIVLFETGIGGADQYGTTPQEIFDLLDGCGLSLTLMEYFLKGSEPFDKTEFCGQFNKGYNYFFMAYNPAKTASKISHLRT